MPVQKTILIVDDDEAVRESISLWLEEFGWEVKGAGSVTEVLGFDKPFDAYIIDLNLEDRDGFNLTKELWNRFGKIPVILMSGYLDAEMRNEAVNHGIDAILKKPFHLEDLNRILASALKKKHKK